MRLTESPILRLGLAVLVGLAAVISYYMHFLQTRLVSPSEQVLVAIYLVGFFFTLAYVLLSRFIAPRLQTFSARAQVAWMISSLLVGAFLLLVIPVRLPAVATQHQLEIVATGQKNPLAQGTEVWVIGLFLDDGTRINATEFELTGNWEVRDDVPISYRQQPATLRWQGMLDSDARLRLVFHPWSGTVNVTWDGISQTIDLYADPGIRKDITLSVPPSSPLLPVIVFLADAVCLGILLLMISVWLATRIVRTRPISVSRWSWLGYATVCAGIWLVYLLAFWPGLLTSDSVDQWRQMLLGQLSDAHPAFHTLTNWLITRLWLSPSMVALAQISALSVVAGLALMRMRHWGAPRWIIWLTCAMFAFSPANGTMVNTIWKDIPYSIALLILTFLVLEIIQSQGRWLRYQFAWIVLGITVACIALYRHNGAPIALGTVVILFVVYRSNWKRLALASTLAVSIIFGVRGVLYRALDVQLLSPTYFATQLMAHHVAAHLYNGTDLTESERAFLQEIRPGDERWPYYCTTVVPTVFDGKFNQNLAETHFSELTQLIWNLFLRQPQVDLEHQLCSSYMIWRITLPLPPKDLFNAVPFTMSEDSHASTMRAPVSLEGPLDLSLVRIQSPVPTIHPIIVKMIARTLRPDLVWLLWRPAFYLYLSIAAAIIASIRARRASYLLFVVPSILNSLLLLATPAQDFRYQYGVYLIGLLFSLYLLFGIPQLREEKTTANNEP